MIELILFLEGRFYKLVFQQTNRPYHEGGFLLEEIGVILSSFYILYHTTFLKGGGFNERCLYLYI